MSRPLDARPCASVLIVDDDARTTELLRAVLVAQGHDVTTVATGVEAMALCKTRKFDCMLLDVVLEGASGLAVAQRLGGSDSIVRPTHVFFISGKPKADFADAIRQGWADGHILKPVAPDELASIVLASLRPKPPAP